ncbi:TPA: hypothetical protein EYP45_01670, partial [Candidatus Peregrinibacteria bacterium]|nr:hypothetical protein [Candidatus Peregrinibacteria bacterium]
MNLKFLTPEEQKTYHATVLFYEKLLENKEKVDIEKMNTDLAVFFTTKKRVFAEAERRTVKIGLEQLEDQYKIIDSLDYSEEIKKEYKKYLGVHIADYKEFLKTPEDKDVYTSVVQIKTALENKTFFKQKTTTDGVVYYPVVKINLQKEKYGVVPKPVIKLINTQKKELAEKNFITKVFIVEKKEKISNAKAKKNRDAIDKDFYAYFEKTSSIDYVGSRFQIDSESTSSEFKANIKNGKIGKYFRGKKGVHCALYVEKYLSPKVGIIVAGDAWTKISNLQAGGALEIIAQRDDLQHLEKRELGAIRKENYNRKYTDSLLQNYEIIKKRFEKKSGLPMILGVHFLHTGTDRTKAQGGNGLLLNARDLYRKNSPKVKHRPAPNSHIFAMEHSYVRTINGNGRSLKNVLVRLWRINRHSAEGKASLDIHSAIIGDLKISIDGGQTYKKISSLPSGLNTILNGKIKFKGIGISDEIGGNVKKEFFALRMATHQNGKAMYSFVQAGQITTKTLREREKKYDTVMKGLDVEFVPLNTLGINSIISQNLIPKIKLYSKEFYEVRALYAQFFNINTVSTTTKIPVFKNREDLKKALNRFDYGLSVGENKEKVGTASQFIQIGNADGT